MRSICFYSTRNDAKIGEMTMSGSKLVGSGIAKSVVDAAIARGEGTQETFDKYKAWANQAAYSKEEVDRAAQRRALAKIDSRASLDRSPKKNHVERVGGLPMYIRRIANHLHQEKGMTISHAIAVAKNAAARMCASGDLNWPGAQQVNPASRAEACAAVADWDARIKTGSVSKVRIAKGLRVMPNDEEMYEILKAMHALVPERDVVEFDMSAEVSKADTPRQMVFGWAQIATDAEGKTLVDKQGDFIDDPTELEDAAYDFVLHSRDGGEMHIRKGVSRMVESFVSTEEKQRAMGIPAGTLPVGWWVGFKVDDTEVWKGVVEGKYPMFSVHGRGVRKAVDDD